jgi:hypothetical protein
MFQDWFSKPELFVKGAESAPFSFTQKSRKEFYENLSGGNQRTFCMTVEDRSRKCTASGSDGAESVQQQRLHPRRTAFCRCGV